MWHPTRGWFVIMLVSNLDVGSLFTVPALIQSPPIPGGHWFAFKEQVVCHLHIRGGGFLYVIGLPSLAKTPLAARNAQNADTSTGRVALLTKKKGVGNVEYSLPFLASPDATSDRYL